MKQIFPKEIIENTAEVHQFRHSSKSKAIYTLLLLFFIGGLVALPLVRVSVYTSARGIVKPNKERVTLTVINSGKVNHSVIRNNKRVVKGDTLLVLQDNGVNEQLAFSGYQISEVEQFIADLSVLLSGEKVTIDRLASSKYQRSFLEQAQKRQEFRIRYKKFKKNYERYKKLFEKGVIASSEFEQQKFELDLAIGAMQQFRKQQANSWQADLTQYKSRLKELEANGKQLTKSKSGFVLTAPIDGTLLNAKPQALGSFINTGLVLGEISPDTELLVECYVSPTDIGLLGQNTAITFQVDAYNYNQWGLATGKVVEIAKDIELVNDRPVFKVRCKMNEKYLVLKNGFRGNLKKGMTLNANFELTERSLYDLLYDKMDDWLNPSRQQLADLKQ